jgi:hypothetical protein
MTKKLHASVNAQIRDFLEERYDISKLMCMKREMTMFPKCEAFQTRQGYDTDLTTRTG